MADRTTLSIQPDVRDKLRRMKIGGETYTDVITRMMEQYDPDEAEATQ